jgi:hypothetical protein
MEKEYPYGYIPPVGKKFNEWTVINNDIVLINIGGSKTRNYRAVTCRCKCGTERPVGINLLTTGKSKGCKCMCGEFNRKKSINESVGTLSRTQFAQYKNSAVRRDITWELSMEYLWSLYILQNKKCSLTGVDLNLEISIPRKGRLNTASIDRIDSSKPYVEGNVQWVHKDINKLKSSFPENEFIRLCTLVAEYSKSL